MYVEPSHLRCVQMIRVVLPECEQTIRYVAALSLRFQRSLQLLIINDDGKRDLFNIFIYPLSFARTKTTAIFNRG